MPIATAQISMSPVLARCRTLASLTPREEQKLIEATASTHTVKVNQELFRRAGLGNGPMLVLDGWAALTRIFSDGRRQILDVIMPGEIIEQDGSAEAIVVALTPATFCPFPKIDQTDLGLVHLLEANRKCAMAQLMRQVARLGRLNAHQRVADWLLEALERLTRAGLVSGNRFSMPLTQEMLSDILGLTSVHVNRMLQAMRTGQLIERPTGQIVIPDVIRLRRAADAWKSP